MPSNKTECAHYYQYDHTLYDDEGDDEDAIVVMRRCRRCKRIETAKAGTWKKTTAERWKANARRAFDAK